MNKKVSTSNMKDSLLIKYLKEKGNCGGRMEECLKESSRMESQLNKLSKRKRKSEMIIVNENYEWYFYYL